MNNISPEQINMIYWIVLAVLTLIVVLSTVKVVLDETDEEPSAFVKRYVPYIFFSWVLIALFFAPSWFPDFFEGKKKKRSPQNVEAEVSNANPEKKSPTRQPGNKKNPKKKTNRSSAKPPSDENEADVEVEDEMSETSERKPKDKEFDPVILKQVRSNKG